MAKWLEVGPGASTAELLASVLTQTFEGERIQFLVSPGIGQAVVQRLRVALSRSRKRHESRGAKVKHFTLHDEIYPFTKDGKRHDCIVMWTQRNQFHVQREILDDVMGRAS